MDKKELGLKFILVGDIGVGKTSMASRFCEERFEHEVPHTVGIEFYSRSLNIGKQSVKILVWDTAGQERFRSITQSYFRDAAAIFIVFDVTKRSTFNAIGRWITDAKELTQPSSIKTVIGNKADLDDEREVPFSEALEYAEQNQVPYYETSALSGDRIQDVFIETASSIVDMIKRGFITVNKQNSGVKTGLSPYKKVTAHHRHETGKCC